MAQEALAGVSDPLQRQLRSLIDGKNWDALARERQPRHLITEEAGVPRERRLLTGAVIAFAIVGLIALGWWLW